MGRVGDRVLGDRITVSGAQPARLNAGGVAPGGLFIEHPVALHRVGLGDFGIGLGRLTLLAQLGHGVVNCGPPAASSSCCSTAGPASSNSVSAAASTRLSCPEFSASIAAADPAAVVAAFTVSRDTDSFLATFVADRPASIICWMPRARWACEVGFLIVCDDLVHDPLDSFGCFVRCGGWQHVHRHAA